MSRGKHTDEAAPVSKLLRHTKDAVMKTNRKHQEGGDDFSSSDVGTRSSGIGAVRFHPRNIRVTGGAMNALTPEDRANGLARHLRGDWGDVSEEDWRSNEEALKRGLPLISFYRAGNGTRFSICTDRDRSWTTVLLLSEC